MWPWTHLVFGYLCYLLVRRSAWRGADRRTMLAVVVGTQVADLFDKSLAWGLGVLPSGRSLGHSVLFAALVVAAVAALDRRRGHPETGVGFGVGYASHLVGDSLAVLAAGAYGELSFLAWPLLPPPPYVEPVGVYEVGVLLASVEPTPLLVAEAAVAGVLGLVVGYHFLFRTGRPGRRSPVVGRRD